MEITGPSGTRSRSILASAWKPALSDTSITSKVRPVGSSTEDRGCRCHILRTSEALPLACVAQSGLVGWAPGAGQAAEAHEQRGAPPAPTSSQVPGSTSQCRSSAYRTAVSSSCGPVNCRGTASVSSTRCTTVLARTGYGSGPATPAAGHAGRTDALPGARDGHPAPRGG